MNKPKVAMLSKNELQKLVLSVIGIVALIYVYFSFFLGPLNKSRASMEKSIADLQEKVAGSKNEMQKAANLEKDATRATTRFESYKALSPEGAPIAWFPPRMKVFFANHKIDKATARLETSGSYKEEQLAEWTRHTWIIDLPQTDFVSAADAIAKLENAEPLLTISRLSMKAGTEDPQFQQVSLAANTAIMKR